MADVFKPLLAKLADGATLDDDDAQAFFGACLRGEPTPAQIAAAVTAMRLRGETVGEIAACARAMRATSLTLDHGFEVVDTCGTGGDGLNTFNISTASALVVAGGGVKVAKHGTRALSSRSGSSDVLAALGVNIEATSSSRSARSSRPASASCSRPPTTAPCGMCCRFGLSSVSAPFSISWGRFPIQPAPGARCWASTTPGCSSRSPACSGCWGPNGPGPSTARAWTR
jgi:hypothetical protein